MKITKKQLRRIIRESLTESSSLRDARQKLLDSQYEVESTDTKYPYGRNRGDVKSTTVYKRKDGLPVPESDLQLLKNHDDEDRKSKGGMAALAGITSTSLSSDGMGLVVKYYRHTAG